MIYSLFKPFLFSLNPELAHAFVKTSGKVVPSFLLKTLTQYQSPRLQVPFKKLPFENPIGLAAGFDKNGDMIPFLSSLGFGFLELGSVTAYPCDGNPKPRIFRLPQDQSLINRMGLPNAGVDAFVKKFKKTQIPCGINIAKTPDFVAPPKDKKKLKGLDDYLATYKKVAGLGSYIVLNLSCPNTKDNETFEDPKVFAELADEIGVERRKGGYQEPVFIKLSPGLAEDLPKIVDLAVKQGFDGFVVSNTTPNRPLLKASPRVLEKIGRGGLSGKALASLSNAQIKRVYDIVGKEKIIMGVGGIVSFEDLLEKMASGASLFQIYTGLIYRGPFFIHELLKKLDRYCKKMGVESYCDLVGEK